MSEDKKKIEESILSIVKELLIEWENQFYAINYYADFPVINRSNLDSNDYFSEIEINYNNKDGNFGTFTSVVIFIQNQQALEVDDAREFIAVQIQECYNELLLR